MRWKEITEAMMTEEYEVDWSKCALVESVPGRLAGAPVLKNTRMPVQIISAETWDLEAKDVLEILHFREEQCANIT